MSGSTPDREFVNAPARHCAARHTRAGKRLILYRGRDYVLTGLYLVPRARGRAALHFVLRGVQTDEAAIAVSFPRRNRRLHATAFEAAHT